MTGKAKNRQTPCFAHRGSGASIAFILVLSLGTILAGCSIPSSGLTTPTNRYALLIGVQEYPRTENNLQYPANDANAMNTLLSAQGWTVQSILLNSSATYDNIQSEINALPTDSTATILVYYSGHGSDDTGTPSIIPYDGLTLQGDFDVTKWITPATLTKWIAAVPAKHRLLILDSCFSGGFTLGDGTVDTAQADYSRMNYQTLDKGLILGALSKFGSMIANNLSTYGDQEVLALSASGSEEVSWEDTGILHGVFTYYLLEASDFGDADGDGYVTVNEAYSYAKKKIKANWNAKYWTYLDIDGDYSLDFLPHISGGTGDLVLYDGSGL